LNAPGVQRRSGRPARETHSLALVPGVEFPLSVAPRETTVIANTTARADLGDMRSRYPDEQMHPASEKKGGSYPGDRPIVAVLVPGRTCGQSRRGDEFARVECAARSEAPRVDHNLGGGIVSRGASRSSPAMEAGLLPTGRKG
jgi:hypothetical protein